MAKAFNPQVFFITIDTFGLYRSTWRTLEAKLTEVGILTAGAYKLTYVGECLEFTDCFRPGSQAEP